MGEEWNATDNRGAQSNWCPASKEQDPKEGRRDVSVGRSLAKVREAHQKALAMAATLEEEIEWLSYLLIRSWLEVQAHSQSRDCCRHRSRGQKKMCHQVQLEDCHAPYLEYHPSWRGSESKGDMEAIEDLNLEEPPELGLEVTSFLQEPAESSEGEDMKAPSPEPPIEELQKWVTWKAQAYETPSWWQELTMVPEVDDYEKLAHEVQASFWLLKRASEQWWVKNDHQAPPALPCLHWKNFLLLPDSIFTCQDIQEIQHEKMVAYAQALQFWAEKVDLPTGSKPCLLVGSVIELWEEMKCYLSFSDEDVFKGVALPKEAPIIPSEEATPGGTQPTPADTPVKEAAVDITMEPDAEKRPPDKFPGWEKVLHPSRPIVTAGEIPPLSKGPRWRPCSQGLGEELVQIPQTEEPSVPPPSQGPLHLPRSWGLSKEQCGHLVLLG